ncbi:MAG: hypothetical protein GX762_08695 [Bacteroidales bacterium]|nr:hypothetical protein [Bacteroidales bacterium]
MAVPDLIGHCPLGGLFIQILHYVLNDRVFSSLITAYCSLLTIHYLLLTVHCSLFTALT